MIALELDWDRVGDVASALALAGVDTVTDGDCSGADGEGAARY